MFHNNQDLAILKLKVLSTLQKNKCLIMNNHINLLDSYAIILDAVPISIGI